MHNYRRYPPTAAIPGPAAGWQPVFSVARNILFIPAIKQQDNTIGMDHSSTVKNGYI